MNCKWQKWVCYKTGKWYRKCKGQNVQKPQKMGKTKVQVVQEVQMTKCAKATENEGKKVQTGIAIKLKSKYHISLVYISVSLTICLMNQL